jgi:hypothetical protein
LLLLVFFFWHSFKTIGKRIQLVFLAELSRHEQHQTHCQDNLEKKKHSSFTLQLKFLFVYF